jgi:polyhydroxybutyrate depolymerase
VYVPAAIDARSSSRVRVPLLVALHGAHQWGTRFEKTSGFDGIAEANRFVVVYPDGFGTASGRNRTWNGGDCCGAAVRDDVDDVTFIRMLITRLRSQYPIDQARVFVVGHSNGGMLAYRLACVLSDEIAAIGVQSTSLAVDACPLSKPVSLVHVHGTSDALIPLGGGPGLRVIGDVVSRPPFGGVRSIATKDGCPAKPAVATETAKPRVTIDTWRPCRDRTAVEFVAVGVASHRWMSRAIGAVDSSRLIWTFLIAHPRR